MSNRHFQDDQEDYNSKFKVVEPGLGVGEPPKRDSSSGKSFATNESVKETSKLEVDSLKVSAREIVWDWMLQGWSEPLSCFRCTRVDSCCSWVEAEHSQRVQFCFLEGNECIWLAV